MATEFQVTGMTCAHCEHAVSTEIGQIAGVQGVEVSATGRLVITSNAPVNDEQVLAAVDEAGYQAVRQP
ncbi:MAG: heavy-metal-associated domain-containing protein [Microlunatus sp.]|nr:heavy-metal-associated domain-containing protein [Microlunatus sp.]MDN5769742.1 heavy-metal-associated domain-containing protein [Microlunatus sp.]MDN5805023.1 heavy-metal-associated domain-containing protein [Microlunatus sp.]